MSVSLGLAAYSGEDLGAAFAFYGERPLNSEQGYQLFYMLWCLAMREGMQYADMLLSIDQLSDSSTCRTESQARLHALGIDEVDFSDCAVPQGLYTEAECAWFAAQEARVHAFLLEDGWLLSDLQHLQAVRQQHQPACWEASPSGVSLACLGEQASRARELAKRFESTLATRVINEESRRVAVERELEQAKSAAHQAQLEVQRRAEQLAQAGSALELAKADLVASQTENRVLQARLEERTVYADERAAQAESLTAKAESRVVELGATLEQAKVSLAESQAEARVLLAHLEERASSAEMHAAQAESLAAKAESRVVELGEALAQAKTNARICQALLEERECLAEACHLQAERRVAQEEARARQAELLLTQTVEKLRQLEQKYGTAVLRADETAVKLADALTVNHHHWQLSEQRLREIEQRQALVATLESGLHAVHQANHQHWLQLQAASGQLAAMRSSTSWRITGPLRFIRRLVAGERLPQGSVGRDARKKTFLRRSLRSALLAVGARLKVPSDAR